MEQSVNTAFVDMSASIPNGPAKILTQAEKMGIPPDQADPHYPGIPNTSRDLDADALITLGKARISAINMANTYATIANGGQRADVHVINKVTDSKGKVLYQYKPHTTQAIKPDIDRDVSYAMQQVVLHGTGANAQAIDRQAAGKTGTATNATGDVSSSWFVGFTPQLATAVMYVRGDGDNALNDWLPPYNGAAGYFGAGYPTATWAAVMKAGPRRACRSRTSRRPAYVTGTPPRGRPLTGAASPAAEQPPHAVVRADVERADRRARRPRSRRRPRRRRRPAAARRACRLTCPSSPTTSPGSPSTGAASAAGRNAATGPRPSVMASREPWW